MRQATRRAFRKNKGKKASNALTRAVVNQMFTEDEVTVGEIRHVAVDMHRVAQALMADTVRVKKLRLLSIGYAQVQFPLYLSSGDAETLRDAFQVNTSVKELIMNCRVVGIVF
jgi:hypothetical protein